MATLLDLSNQARTVEIQGMKIAVYGISAEGLVSLMTRFPSIGKMMSGMDVGLENIADLGPDILGAFLAAGTGSIGDEAAEAIARKLPLSDQLSLGEEILRLTFPRGIDPFVKQAESLGLLVRGAAPSQQPSAEPSKN